MKNKKHVLLFVPVFLLFIFSGCGKDVLVTASDLTSIQSDFTDGKRIGVVIGGDNWCSEVVKSENAQAQGLSGRDSLTKSTGMIFPFPETKLQAFWMKDMKFDIDIVWIKDSQVVDISRAVPAPKAQVDDRDLPRYTPKTAVNVVLMTRTV
jgi:uncharacterized membrane protein (UPF0127 family)